MLFPRTIFVSQIHFRQTYGAFKLSTTVDTILTDIVRTWLQLPAKILIADNILVL